MLVLAAKWLEHRLERANAQFQHLLLGAVAKTGALRGKDLSVQVCSVIRKTGDCRDLSRCRTCAKNGRRLLATEKSELGQQATLARRLCMSGMQCLPFTPGNQYWHFPLQPVSRAVRLKGL